MLSWSERLGLADTCFHFTPASWLNSLGLYSLLKWMQDLSYETELAKVLPDFGLSLGRKSFFLKDVAICFRTRSALDTHALFFLFHFADT